MSSVIHPNNSSYRTHYREMGNLPPDWTRAEPLGRVEWLPAEKTVPVLDFGCGFGWALSRLHASGFSDLEGVDACRESVEEATAAAGSRARIEAGDGRELLRKRAGHYGLILLFDVLEHFDVREAVELLGEVRDALRPGGRVVVRTPNMQALGASFSRYIDLTHRCGFTECSLSQALVEAGFHGPRILSDPDGRDLSKWVPWAPWRGLGLRQWANRGLHQIVYGLREQRPLPRRFAANLEAYAVRESS